MVSYSEILFGLLSTTPEITTLVPVDRMHPIALTQADGAPYIVYREVNSIPIETKEFNKRFAETNGISITVVSAFESYTLLRQIVDAVDEALHGYTNPANGVVRITRADRLEETINLNTELIAVTSRYVFRLKST